jgi:hypothetical protein
MENVFAAGIAAEVGFQRRAFGLRAEVALYDTYLEVEYIRTPSSDSTWAAVAGVDVPIESPTYKTE